MRVAVVHDWLTVYGGAERVLGEILKLYPTADLYSVIEFLPSSAREFLEGRSVQTSFIQGLPFAKQLYRHYLPLMPLAIEQLDLSAYDLIVSSSYAVAKGIITGPDQLHISYVHTPMRYAWDMTHQYLAQAKLQHGLKSWIVRRSLHHLRIWDSRTANGVDRFVTNSHFVARRIRKAYGRTASVIYPPVDVDSFHLNADKQDYYLTVSRLVPYKRVDLIVEAFAQMPDRRLIVVGDGPELRRIKYKSAPNVSLLGYQAPGKVQQLMENARAFVFAAEEDFGIAVVEAQACGTPVILYAKGGGLETVRGLESRSPTGVFFPEQTAECICRTIAMFESAADAISPSACRANAVRFGVERFRAEFAQLVDACIADFAGNSDVFPADRSGRSGGSVPHWMTPSHDPNDQPNAALNGRRRAG